MSEYQRYEFMTCDRPLTRAQLSEVNKLSSHIEASSTHAVIEYNWGDFTHDPIRVLRKYFDAFLYWANWGSPQLAFRFPPGVLAADLISHYDFADIVTFTRHADYDILNIEFGEMEGPDEWIEYELSDLVPIRDELMEGDLRSLYIVWLACQIMTEGKPFNRRGYTRNTYEDDDDYDEGYDEDDEDYDEDEDYEDEDDEEERSRERRNPGEISIMPVPPGFSKLTAAQAALAELFQVPDELLQATARHSRRATKTVPDDQFAEWLKLLPQARKNEYLLRLTRNEPGLSRALITELRELDPHKADRAEPEGERVAYSTLLAESRAIKAQLIREKREREEAARLRRIQEVHARQDTLWNQVDLAAGRGTSAGYNEALQGLIDLRDAANHFNETQSFQERFQTWIQSHRRRPALLRRLEEHNFPLP